MGAVFAVGHCVDVTLHQLEGITNGALRGGDDPLDEGRASPAAVHHRLLVHQSGIPLVVERPAVKFQHTGGDTCLRGLGAERFLSGGQSDGAPLLGSLNAAALCASDLASAGCDHVNDFFQSSLIVASKLPLIDAEGEVAVKGRRPFEADLCGVEVDHQPLRVSPCGEGRFQGCGLAALGTAPVVHEEDALLHDPQERGGKAGCKDEPELLAAAVRVHVFHPFLKGSVLAVGRGHCLLGRVDVQRDAVSVSGHKPVAGLPSEGGGAVLFGDDVDVLGLKTSEEADHLLRVLAGNRAAEVCKGGDAAALEDHRPGVDGTLPDAVSLKGYLYFFFPGFDALETLGQDDRGAAAEDRLGLLFVDPADSLVRVNPALRLSETDRCAADRFGDVLFFVVHRFCGFQGIPDQLGSLFPAMLDVKVRRVFFAESLAAPLVDLSLVASIPEAGADLVDEGVAAAVRLVV